MAQYWSIVALMVVRYEQILFKQQMCQLILLSSAYPLLSKSEESFKSNQFFTKFECMFVTK